MSNVLELYGFPTMSTAPGDWREIVHRQECPYLGRTCLKTRKSYPEATIGTDSDGIAESLGLKASPRVELDEIIRMLEAKISEKTILAFDVRQ